jgi:hypothetical protein
MFFGYVWVFVFCGVLVVLVFFGEMVKSRERDVVGNKLGGER